MEKIKYSENLKLEGLDLRGSTFAQRGSLLIETPVRLYRTRLICASQTKIGAFSYTSAGTKLHMVSEIGRFCSIAENVVFQNGSHGTDILSNSPVFTGELNDMIEGYTRIDPEWQAGVRKALKKTLHFNEIIAVGNDVWIGNGAKILAGVTIGTGAVIGAGAVVTHDIPSYAVAAGVPARIIRMRFSEKNIIRLLESKWWEYGPAILQGLDFADIDRSIDMIQERIAQGIRPFEPVKYAIGFD